MVVVSVGFVVGFLGLAQAEHLESSLDRFEGQILITQELLPRSASAERTIELFERGRQEVLTSADDDATRWDFRFMGFLTEEPRTGELSLDFYRVEDGKWLSSQRLFASPRMRVLSGPASLSAADGVEVGLSYKLKLVAERDGKRVVLAETRLITEAPPRLASRGRLGPRSPRAAITPAATAPPRPRFRP